MNLIFLGPPNAGKGTIADFISKKYNVAHISTGDLFRAEIKAGSELGKLAESYINKGHLVPDELTIKMLYQRVKKPDCEKGFILDGFPRTIPQADALSQSDIKIDAAVNFAVDDELLIRRNNGRRTCRNCGKIYNLDPELDPNPKDPTKCDECGGELYKREDQDPEAFKERLMVYNEQTAPLIEYYKNKKMLYELDGAVGINEIFASTENLLKKEGFIR